MTYDDAAVYYLLVSPWLLLTAVYCWDYGMELLVPLSQERIEDALIELLVEENETRRWS
jgi:hypothetical protein